MLSSYFCWYCTYNVVGKQQILYRVWNKEKLIMQETESRNKHIADFIMEKVVQSSEETH